MVTYTSVQATRSGIISVYMLTALTQYHSLLSPSAPRPVYTRISSASSSSMLILRPAHLPMRSQKSRITLGSYTQLALLCVYLGSYTQLALLCVYIYICTHNMCVCVCVCVYNIYIYMHIHTHTTHTTHTHTHTHTHTRNKYWGYPPWFLSPLRNDLKISTKRGYNTHTHTNIYNIYIYIYTYIIYRINIEDTLSGSFLHEEGIEDINKEGMYIIRYTVWYSRHVAACFGLVVRLQFSLV
jgi:hypothetical protein